MDQYRESPASASAAPLHAEQDSTDDPILLGTSGHELPGWSMRSLQSAKVMMVDDDPWMIELVKTHLEEIGLVDFVSTTDPLDTLPMLRRERPQILLLDLRMPTVSGFEVLRAVRADPDWAFLPVVMLTAEHGAQAKLEALRLGATDFLAKPVDESELVLRVRNTLTFQAFHERLMNCDPATGLHNARSFRRQLDERLQRARQQGRPMNVFCLSVPECRSLLTGMDSGTADALSRMVGLRLEHLVGDLERSGGVSPGSTAMARLGDDRFALLVEGLDTEDRAQACADALLEALSRPMHIGKHEIATLPWIGVSTAEDDSRSTEDLLKDAGLACEQARRVGASHVMFASAELRREAHQRMTLGMQLRHAAQRGELRLHYQPKVCVATGRILGVEALVRWQHPEHGLLLPGRFIALAEAQGLIESIGTWVVEQACSDAADWSRRGVADLSVAVNVSMAQFLTGTLMDTVLRVLTASGLRPDRLILELTESMFMEDVQTRRQLIEGLKALGLRLSIDDFGTGYSCLAYLKDLPVDELKIDRSFVKDIAKGGADLSIVQSIVNLGQRLGMTVTAEGVEQVGQLECLQAMGCTQYQGYLFSPPVPAAELERLLRA